MLAFSKHRRASEKFKYSNMASNNALMFTQSDASLSSLDSSALEPSMRSQVLDSLPIVDETLKQVHKQVLLEEEVSPAEQECQKPGQEEHWQTQKQEGHERKQGQEYQQQRQKQENQQEQRINLNASTEPVNASNVAREKSNIALESNSVSVAHNIERSYGFGAKVFTNDDLAHPLQGLSDKQVKHLKRVDLLELLVAQGEEIEQLRAELAELRKQLEDKRLNVLDAGNIAEASLRLNKIFEDAQAAADQFLYNLRLNAEELSEAHPKPASITHPYTDLHESTQASLSDTLLASAEGAGR